MGSWSPILRVDGLGRIVPVNDAFEPGEGDRAASLPEPTAGTDGTIGDGAPRFASQIEGSVALRDRLDRERVKHGTDDDRLDAA